ncbi:PsiF family protein [Dokdonella sp.]|uniref:PsiF family protein n=1 Tax=Dokdonella sp. TaxID=2291710 RepID=UPI003528733B
MTFRTTLLMAVALCFSVAAFCAWAGGKGSSNADCNAQAAGKSGAEREASMQACMGKSSAAAPSQSPAATSAQQGNKSACQAEAQSRGLTGNERKNFMADCMSNSGGH